MFKRAICPKDINELVQCLALDGLENENLLNSKDNDIKEWFSRISEWVTRIAIKINISKHLNKTKY